MFVAGIVAAAQVACSFSCLISVIVLATVYIGVNRDLAVGSGLYKRLGVLIKP